MARCRMEDKRLSRAASEKELAAALLLDSIPSNPAFALQTGLLSSPMTSIHPACSAVCHKKLVVTRRCGFVKPLPCGREAARTLGRRLQMPG